MRLGIYSGETNDLRSYTLVSCDQSVDGFNPVLADVGKEGSTQRKCSMNNIREFQKIETDTAITSSVCVNIISGITDV